jgi:diguanylate cyclase
MKIFKFVLASLIAVFAFNLVFIVFRPGGEFLQLVVSDCLPIICSILAVIALATAFRSLKVWDEAKAAWFLILLGTACWAIAEATYGFLELVLKIDASPSWADFFWVLGYLPFLTGLFLFLHCYLKSGLSFGKWKRVLIPAAVAFAACVAFTVIFALIPIQADQETSALAKFTYYYYPLGDLAMLAPVIVIIYLTMQLGKGKFSLPWKLIGIGLFCFAVSDIAYSILDWQGLYSGGGITDLGWNLAYLCVALGGASQRKLLSFMDEGGKR